MLRGYLTIFVASDMHLGRVGKKGRLAVFQGIFYGHYIQWTMKIPATRGAEEQHSLTRLLTATPSCPYPVYRAYQQGSPMPTADLTDAVDLTFGSNIIGFSQLRSRSNTIFVYGN